MGVEGGSRDYGWRGDGQSQRGREFTPHARSQFSPIKLSRIGPDRARFDGRGPRATGGHESGSKALIPVIPFGVKKQWFWWGKKGVIESTG